MGLNSTTEVDSQAAIQTDVCIIPPTATDLDKGRLISSGAVDNTAMTVPLFMGCWYLLRVILLCFFFEWIYRGPENWDIRKIKRVTRS